MMPTVEKPTLVEAIRFAVGVDDDDLTMLKSEAKELLDIIDTLTAERDAARRQRDMRDTFLVRRALWQQFTDWLPKGKEATAAFYAELDTRATTPDVAP